MKTLNRIFALRSALIKNPFALASILSGYLWGVALALPGDTLVRPTYRFMREVATEDTWVVVFFTLATLQLFRVFSLTTPKSFPYELVLKMAACVTWTFVGVACLFSQWPMAAAMADTLVVSLFSWIDMTRVRACRGCPGSNGVCGGKCWYERS